VTRKLRIDRIAVSVLQQKAKVLIVNQTGGDVEFLLPQHSFIEGTGDGQIVMITRQTFVEKVEPFKSKELVIDWFSLSKDGGRTMSGRITPFFSEAAGEAFQNQEKVYRTFVPEAAARGWSSEHDSTFLRGLVDEQVHQAHATKRLKRATIQFY
jgi:hypothetical protein